MQPVCYELDGHVAVITLNRPEAMNTFNPDMYRAFNEATERFKNDDNAWVALITAAGEKAFSAGVDIKALDAFLADKELEEAAKYLDILIEGEYYTDKPMIAAIQGYCVGEGLSMALGCDIRICSENASFCLPESKIGVPTVNAAIHATKLMGSSHALELLLLGEHRDAEWAIQRGLVNKVVPTADLYETALDWAKKIASLSPLANRATKEVTLKSHALSFEQATQLGAVRRKVVMGSKDAAEGRRAFIEKRPPNFICG